MHKMSLLLAGVLALALSGPAAAQSPLQKIFGGRKNPTPPPPTTPARESDQRLVEILVELAWLGDPITFPFYIDARVEGQNLYVRGNIPSKSVREQVMKLAQMNSPFPVVDELKENPRLNPRPTRMSPEQLQSVAKAALRESMPRQSKDLQIRCTADGQVAVTGSIENFEQKLAVSHALRRLHGSTVVINLIKVGYDPDGKLARNITHPPVTPTPTATPVPPVVTFDAAAKDVVKVSPPPTTDMVKDSPPIISTPDVKVESAVPAKRTGPQLSLAQVQKRIQDVCPKAKEVRATQGPNGEYKIEIHVRDETEIEPLVNRVYSIPDLEGYQLDVSFVVGAPGKT